MRAARAAAEIADGMLLAAGAETAWHSREVERIALRIADRLGFSGHQRQDVGTAARLHDIGKVALPPSLLQKTTAPNAAEWKLIREHTVVGERILRSVEELRDIAPFVRHSHERWDGEGYPDGLSAQEIPEASRIVFCADAFHAICTDRPYSSGRSMAAALTEIRRCAGTQFEPRVVAALAAVIRDEMYEPVHARRRSHARLSMLMVIAATFAGSIAAGIASSREAASPDHIRDSAPLAAPAAPALETGDSKLAPGLIPRGGVAAAVAESNPASGNKAADGASEPETALEGRLPAAPSPPSPVDSITGAAAEFGNRLNPGSGPGKDRDQPADDGSARESGPVPTPTESPEPLPGIDAAQSVTYGLSSVGAAVTAPAPRPRRQPSRKRR